MTVSKGSKLPVVALIVLSEFTDKHQVKGGMTKNLKMTTTQCYSPTQGMPAKGKAPTKCTAVGHL